MLNMGDCAGPSMSTSLLLCHKAIENWLPTLPNFKKGEKKILNIYVLLSAIVIEFNLLILLLLCFRIDMFRRGHWLLGYWTSSYFYF